MKKLRSMNDLMQTVPEAAVPFRRRPEETSASSKKPKAVTQQQLVVQLPAETIKALKQAALDQETSVRAMLLKALSGAGYPVPAGQDEDRRKAK
jgi:hypothetical protein